MTKMIIMNAENKPIQVDLIRYFKFKNDYFLIYSLGEKDEKNHQKLYLVKIMEELGMYVSQDIKDDDEWNGMKKIVQKIIKEIKSGKRKHLVDLDYKDIENVKIKDPKFFKLDDKLVEILSSSYLEKNDEINELESINENLSEKIENNFVNKVEITSPQREVEPTVDVPIIEPVIPIEPMIDVPTIDSVTNEEEIDYKELYLAEKKANEKTSEILDDLLQRLAMYQEKYGEL